MIPLNLVYASILTALGLIIYAYFVNAGCMPDQVNHITNINQVNTEKNIHCDTKIYIMDS